MTVTNDFSFETTPWPGLFSPVTPPTVNTVPYLMGDPPRFRPRDGLWPARECQTAPRKPQEIEPAV